MCIRDSALDSIKALRELVDPRPLESLDSIADLKKFLDEDEATKIQKRKVNGSGAKLSEETIAANLRVLNNPVGRARFSCPKTFVLLSPCKEAIAPAAPLTFVGKEAGIELGNPLAEKPSIKCPFCCKVIKGRLAKEQRLQLEAHQRTSRKCNQKQAAANRKHLQEQAAANRKHLQDCLLEDELWFVQRAAASTAKHNALNGFECSRNIIASSIQPEPPPHQWRRHHYHHKKWYEPEAWDWCYHYYAPGYVDESWV